MVSKLTDEERKARKRERDRERYRRKMASMTDAERKERDDKRKEYMKYYYAARAEAIKLERKAVYANDHEKIKERNLSYRDRNKNSINARKKLYREEKRDLIREKRSAATRSMSIRDRFMQQIKREIRMDADPGYRIKVKLRTRLAQALRHGAKAGSSITDAGCTIQELRAHLEQQFQPGMAWDNYGRTGWHIDHIKPLASFDLTDRAQFLEACHYTNLQPLWAEDNLRKGARLAPEPATN